MPTVIKEGTLKTTCPRCNSQIGYQPSEVKYPQMDSPHIYCPVCRNTIYNVQASTDHLHR